MDQKHHCREKKRILPETGERGNFVVPLQQKTGIRILNTIIVFLYTLDKFEDIALVASQAIGSKFFRVSASLRPWYQYASTNVGMAIAKSAIVKEAQKKLRLADRIPTGRQDL
jgi:hypothetical protein